jgi:uncharacterized protein YjcR
MMSKKDVYYNEAEKFYIQDQLTIAEIESRLGVCEKTIRTWKSEGAWDEKKKRYLQEKSSFHEELYSFSRKLMQTIQNDWDAGEQVDAGRLYTLTRMLPMIMKVKDYEDIRVSKEKDNSEKGLTEDIVKNIEKEVLGIE